MPTPQAFQEMINRIYQQLHDEQPTELMNSEVATPESLLIDPTTEAKPARVKVTVTCHAGRYTITCNRPFPLPPAVLSCLPAKLQNVNGIDYYAQNGYALKDVMAKGSSAITNIQWANAISRAILRGDAQQTPGEVEATDFNEAYVTMHGLIYRLQPIECVNANKLLTATRQTLLADAKSQAKSILDSATQNAKTITQQAAKIKAEVERERRNKVIPPAWASSRAIPLLWNGEKWIVGMYINYKPKTITHFKFSDSTCTKLITHQWTVDPALPSYPIMFWIPITATGDFNITAAFVPEQFKNLPHATSYKTCMAPADILKSMKNYDDYASVVDSVTRCINGDIYVPSLLTLPNTWSAQVRAFIPTDVLAKLDAGSYNAILDLTSGTVTEELVKNTENKTWTSS